MLLCRSDGRLCRNLCYQSRHRILISHRFIYTLVLLHRDRHDLVRYNRMENSCVDNAFTSRKKVEPIVRPRQKKIILYAKWMHVKRDHAHTDIDTLVFSIHIAATGNSNTVNFPPWIFDSFVVVGVPSSSASVSQQNRRKLSAVATSSSLLLLSSTSSSLRYQIWTTITTPNSSTTHHNGTSHWNVVFHSAPIIRTRHKTECVRTNEQNEERIETISFNGLWFHYNLSYMC